MCSFDSTPRCHFWQVSLSHRPISLRCDSKFLWPVSTCSTSLILYLNSCSSLLVPFPSRGFWNSSFVSRQVDIPTHLRMNVLQAQFHTCLLGHTCLLAQYLTQGLSIPALWRGSLLLVLPAVQRTRSQLFSRDPWSTLSSHSCVWTRFW